MTGIDYKCTRDEFCGRDIKFKVDWSSKTSLRNWIVDMDLHCTSKAQIGLIGAMIFIGWALGATFLPRLSDIYGRKPVYLYSMLGHFIAYLLITLSTDLLTTTILMFFKGLFSVGRATVGYLYL